MLALEALLAMHGLVSLRTQFDSVREHHIKVNYVSLFLYGNLNGSIAQLVRAPS